MALIELNLPTAGVALPGRVREFLAEADDRIDRFQIAGRITAFVPSDYVGAFGVLRALAGASVTRGTRFCEWGSGFGVVACIAAMLDFESCGIEIEPELVQHARQLADDFELPVEFVQGSFVPRGAESRVHAAGEYSWLTTDGDYAYEELGLDPRDLDIIFAYPWPDEESVTAELFDRYAGPGAILVTHHSGDEFRARRKVATKKRR